MTAVYKSIDLFAGIGGIRLGFERAFGESIETVFIANGMKTLKTYYANFPTSRGLKETLRKSTKKTFPPLIFALPVFRAKHFPRRQKDGL